MTAGSQSLYPGGIVAYFQQAATASADTHFKRWCQILRSIHPVKHGRGFDTFAVKSLFGACRTRMFHSVGRQLFMELVLNRPGRMQSCRTSEFRVPSLKRGCLVRIRGESIPVVCRVDQRRFLRRYTNLNRASICLPENHP